MKTKLYWAVSVLVIMVIVFSVMVAAMTIPASDRAKENAKAPEKSTAIATNNGEWELEKIVFIHYAKPTKPPKPPNGDVCYKLLGVKWKSLPVNYVINPTNSDGLTEDFVTSAISTSAETWDDAISNELFKDTYTISYTAQYGVLDSNNTIVFGDYSDVNVIAVTTIWYTRKGRQIVEFDILFDTDFTWGDATGNPDVMDLQNIATHELGHGVGLGDIYTSSCSEVTMYGYSTEGETEKRTLEQPDILGLQKMYGT